MAQEVKKENEPWSIYGDPTLYLPEPRGLKAVLRLQYKDPQAWRVWCRAIRAELTTLIKLSTFVIESPQKGEPVIPTTCTNRVKLLADGDWDKAKSRLCVRGDIQKVYVTEETWSATSTKRTLRMFIADAAKNKSELLQLDFIGAFLQAPVRSTVYVRLDSELIRICPEYAQYYGVPLRLLKSMYGMAYSGKWWYLELANYLVSEDGGFRRSSCDQALFIKKEKDGSITKLLVYVDDSLYFNSKNIKKHVQAFQKQIGDRFKVDFQGQAHWFLAMRILRDRRGNFTIDQSRYAKNIVTKHLGKMHLDAKINRPLPSGWEPKKNDCAKDEQEVKSLNKEFNFEYPSVIGSLIYLLNTRPDLTFAVTKLAKFMKMPGRIHFQTIVYLLKYLNNNYNFGLKYYHDISDSPLYDLQIQNDVDPVHPILGMHDSSWNDCPDTGRSTGSYQLFVQGGPVDFSTFVPAPVAMSSAEAENNAGAAAGLAMSHIRMLWNELNFEDPDDLLVPPILMLCDNKSAVMLANSEKDSTAQRHTKRRLMVMRQLRRELELRWLHLSNKNMLADIGTKNLDVPAIQPIAKIILVELAKE